MSEQIKCPGCEAEHSCTRMGKEPVVVRDSDTETHVENRDKEYNECENLPDQRKHQCRFCGILW